ncbi:MAG: glycosyltransferase [Solibacillus sp.]|uniref:glycosyltransferase n=1 Tax=Solibacillus sp. TaxID=1909654 RepID=UPI003314CA0B
MQNDIMVSIDCITYNHEKYIADAIESFLMQKTNFKIEILIHDDSSTDGTSEIIKKYEQLYPNIIKPIYQKENQHSKGINVTIKYQLPRARGKYIAVCEGDDYWIDPYKLQKQVDYLEKNKNCSLCFHNAEVIDVANGNKIVKKHIPWAPFNEKYYYQKNAKYNAGELALLDFIPTASLIFPRNLVTEISKNPPDWITKAIVGDAPTRLVLASYGYAYFFDEVMSIYRTNVEGSSTERANIENQNPNQLIHRLKGHIEILDGFNEFSHYKYANQLDEAKKVLEVNMLRVEGKIKELKSKRYKSFYNQFNTKERLKIYLSLYAPKTYKKLVDIKSVSQNLLSEKNK